MASCLLETTADNNNQACTKNLNCLPISTSTMIQFENTEPLSSQYDISIHFVPDQLKFIIDLTSQDDGNTLQIIRSYEDFQYLHESLVAHFKSKPVVFPPLPDVGPLQDRVVLPIHSRLLKECNLVANTTTEFIQYLRHLASHKAFASSEILKDFFTAKELTNPESKSSNSKKYKSLLFHVSHDKWKHTHKDHDEFYEKQRSMALDWGEKVESMKSSFERFLAANHKVSNVLAHLSATIMANLVIKENQTQLVVFNKLFCSAIDAYKNQLDIMEMMSYQTLGINLQYMFAYNLSYKTMLFKRIELLVNYENANKSLERAHDSKKYEKASILKKHAEEEFEKFSEEGRQEVECYHQNRFQDLTLAIKEYAESQLALSKQTVQVLRNCINDIKQLSL